MVEQGTENPRVVGSIPTGGTTTYADLAHLVERDLAKVEVAGSSPVIRSNTGTNNFVPVFFSKKQKNMALWPSGKAKVCNTSIPGSIPGGASKTKSTSYEVLFVLERCLPTANDVGFANDDGYA